MLLTKGTRLPIAEAMAVASQLADALDAAHERDIVHRDFKPANIKVRHDGKVRVRDFGLAKTIAGETTGTDPGGSPTLTNGMTRAGMIPGTATYMSPEQARGQPVDERHNRLVRLAAQHDRIAEMRYFGGLSVEEAEALSVSPRAVKREWAEAKGWSHAEFSGGGLQ
jgi:eukaryotic-like serine/threonine-protein kinase